MRLKTYRDTTTRPDGVDKSPKRAIVRLLPFALPAVGALGTCQPNFQQFFGALYSCRKSCAVASPNTFVFYDSSCGSSVAAT